MREKHISMFLLALTLLMTVGCGHTPYVPASDGVNGTGVGYAEAAIPGQRNSFIVTYRTEVVSNPPFKSIISSRAEPNLRRRIREVCSKFGLDDWVPIGDYATKYFNPPCPQGQKPAWWRGEPITCEYHPGGGSSNAASPGGENLGASSGGRNYQAASYAVIVCVSTP
jgi:hypothetical protein